MINTIETGIGLFPIIGIGIGIGFKQTLLIGIGIGIVKITRNYGPPGLLLVPASRGNTP